MKKVLDVRLSVIILPVIFHIPCLWCGGQWVIAYLDTCVLNGHLTSVQVDELSLYITHAPVSVEGGDGLPPTWVQRLCLLQQDALHQPGDVHVDVAGDAVQGGYVGSDSCQQVWGPGYLLGGLVVIGHSHDDPAETCSTDVTSRRPGVGSVSDRWDGLNEPWRHGTALIRSAFTAPRQRRTLIYYLCSGPSPPD